MTKQIDEISKERLAKYAKRAAGEKADAFHKASSNSHIGTYYNSKARQDNDAAVSKYMKRSKGLNKAIDKLANEEVEQVDEVSKERLKAYKGAADKSWDKARAEYDSAKTPEQKTKASDTIGKRNTGLDTANKKLRESKSFSKFMSEIYESVKLDS